MGEGGLAAASVANGVSNYYGNGTNSSVGPNTVQHKYGGGSTKCTKCKKKGK